MPWLITPEANNSSLILIILSALIRSNINIYFQFNYLNYTNIIIDYLCPTF
jgi:hypothetical protein